MTWYISLHLGNLVWFPYLVHFDARKSDGLRLRQENPELEPQREDFEELTLKRLVTWKTRRLVDFFTPRFFAAKSEICTLPETNGSHLKIESWKPILSFWGPDYFQVLCYCLGCICWCTLFQHTCRCAECVTFAMCEGNTMVTKPSMYQSPGVCGEVTFGSSHQPKACWWYPSKDGQQVGKNMLLML